MEEKIIVTLTTWKPRMKNIPTVLDSIFSQTIAPDLVVLNLAYDEVIPEDIEHYLESHNVEVNRMENLKVYKKLVPTLRKYPNDCVISIDDDWIYPSGMIEDFIKTHEKFPDCPVSGNRVTLKELPCHCGCASLTKAEYFGRYLGCIDDRVMHCCASDDLTYTYFAAKNGRHYVRTSGIYFENMESLADESSYSNGMTADLDNTWDYLEARFGMIDEPTVMVHLHINHPYCAPVYMALLKNLCHCSYKIFVTYTENDPEIDDIRKNYPEASIMQVGYSEDGTVPFLDLLNSHPGYDFALKLVTWNSRGLPFSNSLNLSGYSLTKAMTNVFLSSNSQFAKMLDYFRRHPRVKAICGIEGYIMRNSLMRKSFAECCPSAIFMCRAKDAATIMKNPVRLGEIKLVTGLKNSFFKKFIHYLFTIERNQTGKGKIITILSFSLKV